MRLVVFFVAFFLATFFFVFFTTFFFVAFFDTALLTFEVVLFVIFDAALARFCVVLTERALLAGVLVVVLPAFRVPAGTFVLAVLVLVLVVVLRGATNFHHNVRVF